LSVPDSDYRLTLNPDFIGKPLILNHYGMVSQLDMLQFYIFSLDSMHLFKVIVCVKVKIKYQIHIRNMPINANNVKSLLDLD